MLDDTSSAVDGCGNFEHSTHIDN